MTTSASAPKPKPGSAPQSKADPTVVIADVIRAADAVDAPTEVVVEVLRTRLDLGVVPVSHALGIDASQFIRAGTKRKPHIVAAADQLWAAVVPTGTPLELPDLGTDWTAAAACRGKDPNMWFCEGEACDAEIDAVAICTSCPAIGHCAITFMSEQDGLWGGMTHRNRAVLRRYLRLGVVPATPVAIAPLAADVAVSSLQARIASRPSTITTDGRLFPVDPIPESAEVAAHRRARRRQLAKSTLTQPLFEIDVLVVTAPAIENV